MGSISQYQVLLGELLDIVPQERAGGDVLAIGTGDGELEFTYLERYPLASLVSARAAELYPGETRFAPASLDVVVAVLALGSLDERVEFLRRLRGWLRPGGMLILAELLRAADDHIRERNRWSWQAWQRAGEVPGELPPRSRTGLSSTPLKVYLDEFERAGFAAVDCTWRHQSWGILTARRPSGQES